MLLKIVTKVQEIHELETVQLTQKPNYISDYVVCFKKNLPQGI